MAHDALNRVREQLKRYEADPRARMFKLDEFAGSLRVAFDAIEQEHRALAHAIMVIDAGIARDAQREPQLQRELYARIREIRGDFNGK